MYCCCKSYGLEGIEAFGVTVEVSLSRGLPAFEVVGLPDAAVKEARDRVRSAFLSVGCPFPVARAVVNLAPADRRKSGPVYDLPIFLAIRTAQGQMPDARPDQAFVGELSLSGEVRPVRGVLSMALQARQDGIRELFVPAENASEGAVVEGLSVYGVEHLSQLEAHLRGEEHLTPAVYQPQPGCWDYPVDLSEVQGQAVAKRALEAAAAGGHNLLLIGPPGSGKSMLAKRLPTILPPLSFAEAVETTRIHSVAGRLDAQGGLVTNRPFRAPHHTVSAAGLSGGGSSPVPGEVSLAHNGVLFLDELPEFSRSTLEVLRQPMEDSQVTISRASSRVTYPCSVMVVAAMNPCPCGYLGHPTIACSCSAAAVSRYLGRVSGPLLDRMDIQVEVAPLEYRELAAPAAGESSAQVRQRVLAARALQEERFAGSATTCNARMTPAQVRAFCPLAPDAQRMLARAFDSLGLSARGYDRILKVARTLADLDASPVIAAPHLAEAIQYRTLDRKYWRP